MVVIVIDALYPAKIAPLVAQKYIEVTKKYGAEPDKSVGNTILLPIQRVTKDGIRVLSAYECKDDKVKDMIMALAKAMLMYNELEGYHYSMDMYIDMTEAYSLVGMKGPQ